MLLCTLCIDEHLCRSADRPIGLFLGGFMVDDVCEPFMVRHGDLPILRTLFGTGKGSGAALMMFILGVTGSLICIIVGGRLKKYHYNEM